MIAAIADSFRKVLDSLVLFEKFWTALQILLKYLGKVKIVRTSKHADEKWMNSSSLYKTMVFCCQNCSDLL